MKQIILLLFFFTCGAVHGQRLQKTIGNTAGAVYTSNNIQLKMSVGEPVVGNLDKNNSTILSQGFFTGFTKLIVTDPVGEAVANSISLYPNPTKDILFLKGNIEPVKEMHIFDMSGHRISVLKISAPVVTIRDLPAGFYIGKLIGQSAETLTVFKIVKL